jgi:hypothetical protein
MSERTLCWLASLFNLCVRERERENKKIASRRVLVNQGAQFVHSFIFSRSLFLSFFLYFCLYLFNYLTFVCVF